jgi:hypothetical protein
MDILFATIVANVKILLDIADLDGGSMAYTEEEGKNV